MNRKRAVPAHLRALRPEMAAYVRINRTPGFGDVPPLLERILAAMSRRRLHDDVRVAGECALFAYAAEAGVRLREPVSSSDRQMPFALQLWAATDAAKDLAFDALRSADKTFIVREVSANRLQASNAQGATVEIRHDRFISASFVPPGPLAGPKFSAVVVTASGRMARMTAIPPTQYILDAFHQAQRADLTPAQSGLYAWRARATQRLLASRLPDWNEAFGAPNPLA